MTYIRRFCVAAICLLMTVDISDATCKRIKENNKRAPSGEYTLTSCETGRPIKVYCEMGLNGGGYTFIKYKELADLTQIELQSMFTDATSFLLRLRKCSGGGGQPYVVLKQLANYASIPLKLALNGDRKYAIPQNDHFLGQPYLYFGFLPIANANTNNTQGLWANGQEYTFTNCDNNPNSYFALFPNFNENQPTTYLFTSDYPLINQIFDGALPNPSSREMPVCYFYFMEAHFGGCGWFTQTDSRLRSGQRCITSAAIGFR